MALQLKFLYVAVTRARQNLYIVDTSDTAGPMKVLDKIYPFPPVFDWHIDALE